MNEEIDITYNIDRKQHISEIRKRLFRSGRWVREALLLTAFGVILYFSKAPDKDHTMAFVVPIVLFLVHLAMWWRAPARWIAQNPYAHEPKHMRITPERLFLETESAKSEFPWTHFLAWKESPANFMLDIEKIGYCSVIPKSAMTPEQQALFRQWASAKLPRS
jgi:hypothetical protein